jgi:hypothetical protein
MYTSTLESINLKYIILDEPAGFARPAYQTLCIACCMCPIDALLFSLSSAQYYILEYVVLYI